MLRPLKINFRQLYDATEFNKIKIKFLKNDFSYLKKINEDPENPLKIDLNNNYITIEKSSFGIEEFVFGNENFTASFETNVKFIELEFFKDYLSPALDLIPINFKNHLKFEIEKDRIYSDRSLEKYDLGMREKLSNVLTKIESASHLKDLYKNKISKIVYDCLDELNEIIKTEENQLKLNFNFQATTLMAIFYLLKKKSIITNTETEIGSFIEKNFTVKNGPVKEVYKTFNKFTRPKDPKSIKPSIKKLRDIFI